MSHPHICHMSEIQFKKSPQKVSRTSCPTRDTFPFCTFLNMTPDVFFSREAILTHTCHFPPSLTLAILPIHITGCIFFRFFFFREEFSLTHTPFPPHVTLPILPICHPDSFSSLLTAQNIWHAHPDDATRQVRPSPIISQMSHPILSHMSHPNFPTCHTPMFSCISHRHHFSTHHSRQQRRRRREWRRRSWRWRGAALPRLPHRQRPRRRQRVRAPRSGARCILFLHPDTHFSHMSHTPFPHISELNSFSGYRAPYISETARVLVERGPGWLRGLRDSDTLDEASCSNHLSHGFPSPPPPLCRPRPWYLIEQCQFSEHFSVCLILFLFCFYYLLFSPVSLSCPCLTRLDAFQMYEHTPAVPPPANLQKNAGAQRAVRAQGRGP